MYIQPYEIHVCMVFIYNTHTHTTRDGGDEEIVVDDDVEEAARDLLELPHRSHDYHMASAQVYIVYPTGEATMTAQEDEGGVSYQ